MKTYRYLFYKIYCIWLKRKDEENIAHIKAVLTLTLLISLNILGVQMLCLSLFRLNIFGFLKPITLEVKLGIILFLICFGLINYFKLAYKKKYIDIVEEFTSISKKKNTIYSIFVWLYVIFTLGIFPFLMNFFPLC